MNIRPSRPFENDFGSTIYTGPPQGHVAVQKLPPRTVPRGQPGEPESSGTSQDGRSIHEQLAADARKANQEDLDRAEILEPWMKLEGTKLFFTILAGFVQAEGETLLLPAKGMDGMVNTEFVKGTLFGLLRAKGIPERIIEAAKGLRPSGSAQENTK